MTYLLRATALLAAAAPLAVCVPALAHETTTTAHADTAHADTAHTDTIAMLDREAPRLLSEHDVPSVGIAWIEDGEIAFVRHYGFQTWGYPANEETLYNVASLTKPVTAEVVMRLVAAGDLALDTPLADHHVEQDVADDPRIALLTPEVVMHHRTGFPNWRYMTDGVLSFQHDPGTQTGYSGEGYEWMMLAAQAAAGEDFEDLAQRLVFDPAGMEFTSYTLSQDFVGRLAVPYKAGAGVYNVVRREPSASDDLRSTPREYARFMLDVWEGDAVPAELRQRQRTIVHYAEETPHCARENPIEHCPDNVGWGLGWMIMDYPDRTIVQHTGGDEGERALAFYDVTNRKGAVILTNGAEGHHVMVEVAALLDGDTAFVNLMQAMIAPQP